MAWDFSGKKPEVVVYDDYQEDPHNLATLGCELGEKIYAAKNWQPVTVL